MSPSAVITRIKPSNRYYCYNTPNSVRMKKINKPIKTSTYLPTDTRESRQESKENKQPLRTSFINHPNISNSSLITNMKLELSNIKIDVEKLMKEDSEGEGWNNCVPSKLEVENQSVRFRLAKSQEMCVALRQELEGERRQQGRVRGQLREVMEENKELVARVGEIEGERGRMEIEMLKLETEYHRVDGLRSRLEKEQEFQFEFQTKLSEEKLKLQNQNLDLQAELREERTKNGNARQLSSLKEKMQAYKVEADRLRISSKKQKEETESKQALIQTLQASLRQLETARASKDKQTEQQSAVQTLRIQELQGIISHHNSIVSVFQQQKQTLQRLVQDQNAKIRELNASLNVQKEGNVNLHTKYQNQEQQISQLNTLIQTLEVSRGSSEQKLTTMTQQVTDKTQQIHLLRSELESSRRPHIIPKLEQPSRQIIKSTNHLEMELQNKTNQIQILKKKMEALNKKIETKASQLKQKDQFMANVILNKAKKEGGVFDIQDLKQELDKYFSSSLQDQLELAQKTIEKLTEESQSRQSSGQKY